MKSFLLPMLGLCFAAILLTPVQSRLSIKSPEALKNKFNRVNEIDYIVLTPQNKITYKRAFIGNLVLSDPISACSNVSSVRSSDDDGFYNPILIANWGDCNYAQKVKNAEIAGAKMLVLVFNENMGKNHPSIRQLPMQTNLEVLLVSKSDGDKLISYLNEVKGKPKNDPSSYVEMTYSYDNEKHVNFQASSQVIVDYWFVSSDIEKSSYEFLSQLSEILKDFGDKVAFKPHYVHWRCKDCVTQREGKPDPRCIQNGLYCDPEVALENKLTGAKGVEENLRQICFRTLSDKMTVGNDWWKYVLGFGNQCVDKDIGEINACRQNLYSSAGISSENVQKVERCFDESFKVSTVASKYLEEEFNLKEIMHVDHYPSLYINKERYIGSYRNRNAVKSMLCSHFVQESLPATCTEAPVAASSSGHTASDIMAYIGIVFICIVIMATMLYCVRRTVKRQVMGRMNEEIASIVSQYKAIGDKTNDDI